MWDFWRDRSCILVGQMNDAHVCLTNTHEQPKKVFGHFYNPGRLTFGSPILQLSCVILFLSFSPFLSLFLYFFPLHA